MVGEGGPLGKPVVPDVYWMLTGSSQESSSYGASGPARPSSASQLGSPMWTVSRNCGHLPRTCSTIAR